MAHCVGSCGAAICPESDEKRKCVAERVQEAATAAPTPAAWRWSAATPGCGLGGRPHHAEPVSARALVLEVSRTTRIWFYYPARVLNHHH